MTTKAAGQETADASAPRLTGTPAATTRGFGTAEFTLVGELISEVLDGLAATNSGDNAAVEAKVRSRIHDLCNRFPIYGGQSLAAAAE